MAIRFRSNKRVNYFTGQLLGEEDFQAEQQYHLDIHRGHNRALHTWGVVEGLELERIDDATILVRPGSAIDALGREFRLESPQKYPLSAPPSSAATFISIEYVEDFEDGDRSTDNTENFTRKTEFASLRDAPSTPSDDGSVILLGKIQFDGPRITSVTTAPRHIAGTKIAPGTVGSQELAANAVTFSKLSPELRSGWVRLPFKPSPFAEPQSTQNAVDFSIGVTKTYCDPRGAKGTMAIPAPPLASRVKTFVIAGERIDVSLDIELHRSGWDVARNVHEKTQLLHETIPKTASFYKSWSINSVLDSANHTLAIYVAAAGECSISLVAAEFEWSGVK